MKKFTFEQAKEKILGLGFSEIEFKPEKGIVNLGVFALNYCPCCKRQEGKIGFYHQDDGDIWIWGFVDGFSWNDPFDRESLRYALRQLGIKSKNC